MSNNRSYKSKRQNTTSTEAVVVEAIFKGLWGLIVFIFRLIFGKNFQLKKVNGAEIQRLQGYWADVELHTLQEGNQSLAVSEADKILDAALKLKGFSGETMGDRLKMASSAFSADLYNEIWAAHKLRNALAHEIGRIATKQEAQTAISAFRRALNQLGIL